MYFVFVKFVLKCACPREAKSEPNCRQNGQLNRTGPEIKLYE
jgi:hypothetical protein